MPKTHDPNHQRTLPLSQMPVAARRHPIARLVPVTDGLIELMRYAGVLIARELS
jgi:hypothetical protein